MRIHVMSDLHFEFQRGGSWIYFLQNVEDLQKKAPSDIAVLAGDICTVGASGALWESSVAQICSMYKHVLYVPGNHEYYGNNFDDVTEFIDRKMQGPNLSNFVNLDRLQGAHEVGGQRFIGGTMWFEDKGYRHYQKQMLSDFWLIKKFEPEVYHLHRHFLKKFAANVRSGDIVVTHHTPLPESIHPQYHGSDINDFFMSDRSGDLYEGKLPKLWIHGHTHNHFDYQHQVGSESMRVYCNPHGYPNEGENPQFWNKVAIDV